jgi:hypothetical protein
MVIAIIFIDLNLRFENGKASRNARRVQVK